MIPIFCKCMYHYRAGTLRVQEPHLNIKFYSERLCFTPIADRAWAIVKTKTIVNWVETYVYDNISLVLKPVSNYRSQTRYH
jgi:hypothetical protein